MALKIKIQDIESLLQELSIQTEQSLDYYGLGQISLKMDGAVSQRYLNDSLVKPIEKAEKNGIKELNLAPDKVDEISKFLGFDNFKAFLIHINHPIDPVLKSCEGTYYSYLRRSTEKGVVFQSPVKIYEEGHEMWLTMDGPQRGFIGEVRLVNNCLVCLLKVEADDKEFHHVYQIGTREQPEVLLGVFSGMTTSGSPIGGRSILVRQNDDFECLKVNKISIVEMIKSENIIDRRVAEYFIEFSDNNLQVPIPRTFTLDDLGSCD